jgi:hypothetical protein
MLPPGGATPRSVVAQVPNGMSDADIDYWNALNNTPLQSFGPGENYMLWSDVGEVDVIDLRSALWTLEPGTVYTSSYELYD